MASHKKWHRIRAQRCTRCNHWKCPSLPLHFWVIEKKKILAPLQKELTAVVGCSMLKHLKTAFTCKIGQSVLDNSGCWNNATKAAWKILNSRTLKYSCTSVSKKLVADYSTAKKHRATWRGMATHSSLEATLSRGTPESVYADNLFFQNSIFIHFVVIHKRK